MKKTTITTNPYQVGDIMMCTWGWEQTNVDFYQVVRTTAKSVWIRPINHTSEQVRDDEYHVEPIANAFTDNEPKGEMHRVCGEADNPYLKMNSYSIAEKYHGEDVLETTYA